MTRSKRYIPSKIRRQVWARAKGRCELCGRVLVKFKTRIRFMSADEVGHIDHIVPLSKGGRTVSSNLRLICGTTNLSRGAADQTMYRSCAEVA